MMADVTQAPEQFSALCKTLYGDVIDADVVWESVAKRSGEPDLRRNVERGSNALGITAGSLGLAGALKDDRLKDGGRVARRLHATGQKMPKVFGRIKSPRAQAALAAGAVGTQVGNLGGDFLIAGTLGEKKPVRKAGSGMLFEMPKGVPEAVAGLRRTWGKAIKPPKAPGTPPAAVGQPALPGLDSASLGQPSKARALGSNLMGAARSKEGQTGMALGAAGTLAVTGRKKQSGGDYMLGKRDAPVKDVLWKGEFSKVDEDKRLAFGWASVVELNGSPVVDRQGDYIEPEEIEKAAYAYVHGSRVGGDMHRRNGEVAHKVSDLVESMVFTDDKIAKMGLPDDFPRGWWVGFKVHDDETWELVKKKERTGFSIHGRGVRKDHDLDSLMGY